MSASLISLARDRVSVSEYPDTAPEYTRGVLELTGAILGLDSGQWPMLHALIWPGVPVPAWADY